MLPKLPIWGLPPINPAARTTISPPASNPKAQGCGSPKRPAAQVQGSTSLPKIGGGLTGKTCPRPPVKLLPPIISSGWTLPKGMTLSGPQFFKDPYIEARTVLPDEFKAAGLDEALVVFNEIDTANKESPNFVIPEFRDSKTKEELRPWLGRISEDFRDKKEASISAFRYFLFAISSKPKEVQRDQIAQLAVSFQHCGDGRLDAMIKLTAQLENRDTSDGVYAGPIVGKIIQKFKQDLLYEMFVNDKHLQASHGRNYVMARYGELIGAAGAPSFDHFVLTKEMSSLVSGSLRDKCLFTRDPTAKRNNVKEFLVPEYQRRLIQHVGKEINRLLEAPVVGLKAYNALVGILTDPEVCFELIEDDGHSLKILITPEGTKQILEALGYIVPEKPA